MALDRSEHSLKGNRFGNGGPLAVFAFLLTVINNQAAIFIPFAEVHMANLIIIESSNSLQRNVKVVDQIAYHLAKRHQSSSSVSVSVTFFCPGFAAGALPF